ncbi:response regulator transcription factor [Paenibacillus planticolens]|uniref:Response regulator n=1 Tax=Paenibacillus planticolens TaxID=2654976 RepID=A0ABX1ZHL5_9BACL|nr:response regulator [Paenibacillus planticolens]NOU98927.1 response regulator [Paenibacillus planticolens]
MRTIRTVLIVDDEPRTREGVRKTLEAEWSGEIRVMTAGSAIEAATIMKENPIHLLITDIRMPEISGLELVENLREGGFKVVVILISGHAVFDYAQQAIELGVVQYLLKPLEKRVLVEAVKQAMELEKTRELQSTLEKVVDTRLLELNGGQASVCEPIEKAIRYVEEHLGEGLSLKEVADHVHLNASYFSHLFKERIGFTFSEYTSRRMLQKGKKLLLMTNLPVHEIAEQVGYQNSKSFIKVFKKYTGFSPGQFRKQMTEGTADIGRDEI